MELNASIKKKLDSWEYSSKGCSAVILENGRGFCLFVNLLGSLVRRQQGSVQETLTEDGVQRVRLNGICLHLTLSSPKR